MRNAPRTKYTHTHTLLTRTIYPRLLCILLRIFPTCSYAWPLAPHLNPPARIVRRASNGPHRAPLKPSSRPAPEHHSDNVFVGCKWTGGRPFKYNEVSLSHCRRRVCKWSTATRRGDRVTHIRIVPIMFVTRDAEFFFLYRGNANECHLHADRTAMRMRNCQHGITYCVAARVSAAPAEGTMTPTASPTHNRPADTADGAETPARHEFINVRVIEQKARQMLV